jgi:hypothetical protein
MSRGLADESVNPLEYLIPALYEMRDTSDELQSFNIRCLGI